MSESELFGSRVFRPDERLSGLPFCVVQPPPGGPGVEPCQCRRVAKSWQGRVAASTVPARKQRQVGRRGLAP